jgi:hypothetical protein
MLAVVAGLRRDASGPAQRLVFWRALAPPPPAAAVPPNPCEAADVGGAAHDLLFAYAERFFLHGHARLRLDAALAAGAALLAEARSLWARALDFAVDTLASVRAVALAVLPAYVLLPAAAVAGGGAPGDDAALLAASQRRGYGGKPSPDALPLDDLAVRLYAALADAADAAAAGGSRLAAQRAFIALVRGAAPAVFGAQVFAGCRPGRGDPDCELLAIGPDRVTILGTGARAFDAGVEFLLAPPPAASAAAAASSALRACSASDTAAAFDAADAAHSFDFACANPRAVKLAFDCLFAATEALLHQRGWPEPYYTEHPAWRAGAAVVDVQPRAPPAFAAMPALPPPPPSSAASSDAASPPSSDAGLPPHWWAVFGANGDVVFFNELSETVQRERPVPLTLPPPWERVFMDDGTCYYANSESGRTTWWPPDPEPYLGTLLAALPPRWTMAFTEVDAIPYFVGPNGVRSWTHPNARALENDALR